MENEIEEVSTGSVQETPSLETTEAEQPQEAAQEAPSTDEPSQEALKEQPTDELTLPDGRKADPKTVVQEYKNLLSDYTRKSQELANYKRQNLTNPNEGVDYDNPEWVPQTYSEIITTAVERAKEAIKREAQQEQEAQAYADQQLSAQIDTQLEEVRKLDSKVNENRLFEHAAKYGIPNLVNAYHNMRAQDRAIEEIRKQTATSIQKRSSDPIATTPGQESPVDDAQVYEPHIKARSLVDYLRELKK